MSLFINVVMILLLLYFITTHRKKEAEKEVRKENNDSCSTAVSESENNLKIKHDYFEMRMKYYLEASFPDMIHYEYVRAESKTGVKSLIEPYLQPCNRVRIDLKDGTCKVLWIKTDKVMGYAKETSVVQEDYVLSDPDKFVQEVIGSIHNKIKKRSKMGGNQIIYEVKYNPRYNYKQYKIDKAFIDEVVKILQRVTGWEVSYLKDNQITIRWFDLDAADEEAEKMFL